MSSSRYNRPSSPAPFRIQERDKQILLTIFKYRYCTSEHIYKMHFEHTSMRRAQTRLRGLWHHGYIDRYHLPVVLASARQSSHQASRPIYSLDRDGAKVISSIVKIPWKKIPHTPNQNAKGYTTLEHHLVVTDFMVSLEVQTKSNKKVILEGVEPESSLRRRIAWHRQSQGGLPEYLVSDGAFTLVYSDSGARQQFHVEIVRAGIAGGNKKLLVKLDKYIKLHRQGFFKKILGHDSLRAVLIMTTTPKRARCFMDLASTLKHGRRLFWFGSYSSTMKRGAPNSCFTGENILDRVWHDGDSNLFSLTHPDGLPRAEPSA